MPDMIEILVLPDNKIVQASHHESILSALIRAKIEIDHTCGGNGTCGTCRVYVEKSAEKLGPRGEIEAEIASDRGFVDNERLCCQNHPVPGLTIRRP